MVRDGFQVGLPAMRPASSATLRSTRQPTHAAARLLAGLAACLLALSLTGCGSGRDANEISASGHVEATEVRVATKVSGRLSEVRASEGSRVAEGEVLAQVDTVDIALALDATRAERDQAAAELSLRVAGSRVEEIAEAEAQAARAAADLEGAERDLQRMQGLLDRGSGTEKARDDARTRRDIAAASLDAAREQLRRRRAGSRPQEIDSARARLAAAEAHLNQLAQQMQDATIRSPLAGTVTAKLVESGELLPAGAALFLVTDLAHPWLTAYVAEPDLGRIVLGQKADVVTDGGESRGGTVTFISEEAEFTPKNVQTREERSKLVYKVKISMENKDGLFKAGMPAEARLRANPGKTGDTGNTGNSGNASNPGKTAGTPR